METREVQDAVMREYAASLTVPPQPERRQFILCPVGLVGAGKTTVLAPLAERLALVRISGDEIRRHLKEHGLGYDGLVRIGWEVTRGYLSRGYSIALDSDAAGPRSRRVIEDAEREFGALPVWVHVNPPEEFILEKLRAYNHTWLFKDAEDAIENYRRRKPLHTNLTDIPFIYTFDPSRADLAMQIEEAARLIEKVVACP